MGGAGETCGADPLVRVEEEAERGGVEQLDGSTALIMSWPRLEKLKSLRASGGMLLSCGKVTEPEQLAEPRTNQRQNHLIQKCS